jgi:hypothetical protein
VLFTKEQKTFIVEAFFRNEAFENGECLLIGAC